MRVCFVGDSFVNGTGDPDCLGWAGRVCAAARHAGRDVTYYNLGVRRETSADVAARWEQEVARRLPPDHPEYDPRVVFSFGVNDTTGTTTEGGGTRIPPDRSLEDLRAILVPAQRRYPVLFVGPPPVASGAQNQRIAALSSDYAGVCAELGVPYLATFATLSASPTWMREVTAGDGSHPGAGGYAELANLVSAWEPWKAWLV
ncbi:MAG: GDSL-type esterase/lipase family protein [Chloroflexota bacterium]|nr:GDSL-type esterase/lipase family protein [Chloroflexota bacterium]